MNASPKSVLPVKPQLALVTGIAAVSTGAIFARLADSAALVTAAYRLGMAVLVLLPFALFRALPEIRRLSVKDRTLTALAGLFLALHFATWITSLDYTAVANSVVLVNTHPIWVGLMSPFLTREHVHPRTAAGILLGVMGGAIIGAGDLSAPGKAVLGDVLALAGGICAAFYLMIGRNLRPKLSLLAYVTICYGSAAVLLWAVVLCAGLPVRGFDARTWGALWGMALLAQIVGHSSYNWALKWFSSGLVSVGLLGEPIGATLLAYLIFNEKLTWAELIGGVFILAAIVVAASAEGRQAARTFGSDSAAGPRSKKRFRTKRNGLQEKSD